MVEQKDLDEFRYRQVIVNDEVPGTKSFTPEDLNKIIAFVNQNSNIFKKQKLQKHEFQNEEEAESNFQISSIQHLYDSLNAHVFQVIETSGRAEEFSEKTQYILKVPRIQTKKGVLDLVFETQLQQYLAMKKFPYQF